MIRDINGQSYGSGSGKGGGGWRVTGPHYEPLHAYQEHPYLWNRYLDRGGGHGAGLLFDGKIRLTPLQHVFEVG